MACTATPAASSSAADSTATPSGSFTQISCGADMHIGEQSVDVHADDPAAVASQDEVRRLHLLAQELHSTLAKLDANAP